ncbi:response regulator [Lignipirellula cremea]|uniref:Response regulator rcp1 n=1 Tax=Lignipirellula cremea TaxID=2528010 RepID=A0A518DNL5_9BACT|nr:response regulator [Lignipirellula cremea]QDU93432.1 Response regulator rcp1 [Lignipirellula cremea]
MNENTVHILLVEDDEVSAEAVERAFRKARIANPIHLTRDGIEALDKLRGNGVEPIPRPYIILLDLNMPRMNGLEFLEELRSDPELKRSIVFVLTTSSADRDRLAAYDQFVAGYVVKSKVGDDFMNFISMLDHYWRVVEFPPRD